MLATAISAAVAAKAASLSQWWVAAALGVVAVTSMAVALPPVVRTLVRLSNRSRRHLEFARSWPRFQREAEERGWLYGSSHSHSLPNLLSALRNVPSAGEGRDRLNVLQADVATTSMLGDVFYSVLVMAGRPWPGEAHARPVIKAFEALLNAPNATGRCRMLEALENSSEDARLAKRWLDRYRASLEQYGRFARDQNKLIDEAVYRENF